MKNPYLDGILDEALSDDKLYSVKPVAKSAAYKNPYLEGILHDADSREFRDERTGQGKTTRVLDLLAPEVANSHKNSKGELLGAEARDYGQSLLKGGFTPTPTGGSTYGRPIEDIKLADGSDYATRMIESGYADVGVSSRNKARREAAAQSALDYKLGINSSPGNAARAQILADGHDYENEFVKVSRGKVPVSLGNDLAKGFHRGGQMMKESTGGLIEGAGQVAKNVGLSSVGQGIKDYGHEMSDNARADMEKAENRKSINSTDEIHGLGDFAHYAAGMVGEVGAQAIPFLATAVLPGGALLKALQLASGAVKAAELGGSAAEITAAKLVAEQAAKKLGAQQLARGYAVNAPQLVGENMASVAHEYNDKTGQFENNLEGNLLSTTGTGLAAAALDTASLHNITKAFKTAGTDSVLQKAGKVAGSVLAAGAIEGTTEAGQKVLEEVNLHQVSSDHAFAPKGWWEMVKEDFYGGAVGGSAMHSISGATHAVIGAMQNEDQVKINNPERFAKSPDGKGTPSYSGAADAATRALGTKVFVAGSPTLEAGVQQLKDKDGALTSQVVVKGNHDEANEADNAAAIARYHGEALTSSLPPYVHKSYMAAVKGLDEASANNLTQSLYTQALLDSTDGSDFARNAQRLLLKAKTGMSLPWAKDTDLETGAEPKAPKPNNRTFDLSMAIGALGDYAVNNKVVAEEDLPQFINTIGHVLSATPTGDAAKDKAQQEAVGTLMTALRPEGVPFWQKAVEEYERLNGTYDPYASHVEDKGALLGQEGVQILDAKGEAVEPGVSTSMDDFSDESEDHEGAPLVMGDTEVPYERADSEEFNPRKSVVYGSAVAAHQFVKRGDVLVPRVISESLEDSGSLTEFTPSVDERGLFYTRGLKSPEVDSEGVAIPEKSGDKTKIRFRAIGEDTKGSPYLDVNDRHFNNTVYYYNPEVDGSPNSRLVDTQMRFGGDIVQVRDATGSILGHVLQREATDEEHSTGYKDQAVNAMGYNSAAMGYSGVAKNRESGLGSVSDYIVDNRIPFHNRTNGTDAYTDPVHITTIGRDILRREEGRLYGEKSDVSPAGQFEEARAHLAGLSYMASAVFPDGSNKYEFPWSKGSAGTGARGPGPMGVHVLQDSYVLAPKQTADGADFTVRDFKDAQAAYSKQIELSQLPEKFAADNNIEGFRVLDKDKFSKLKDSVASELEAATVIPMGEVEKSNREALEWQYKFLSFVQRMKDGVELRDRGLAPDIGKDLTRSEVLQAFKDKKSTPEGFRSMSRKARSSLEARVEGDLRSRLPEDYTPSTAERELVLQQQYRAARKAEMDRLGLDWSSVWNSARMEQESAARGLYDNKPEYQIDLSEAGLGAAKLSEAKDAEHQESILEEAYNRRRSQEKAPSGSFGEKVEDTAYSSTAGLKAPRIDGSLEDILGNPEFIPDARLLKDVPAAEREAYLDSVMPGPHQYSLEATEGFITPREKASLSTRGPVKDTVPFVFNERPETKEALPKVKAMLAMKLDTFGSPQRELPGATLRKDPQTAGIISNESQYSGTKPVELRTSFQAHMKAVKDTISKLRTLDPAKLSMRKEALLDKLATLGKSAQAEDVSDFESDVAAMESTFGKGSLLQLGIRGTPAVGGTYSTVQPLVAEEAIRRRLLQTSWNEVKSLFGSMSPSKTKEVVRKLAMEVAHLEMQVKAHEFWEWAENGGPKPAETYQDALDRAVKARGGLLMEGPNNDKYTDAEWREAANKGKSPAEIRAINSVSSEGVPKVGALFTKLRDTLAKIEAAGKVSSVSRGSKINKGSLSANLKASKVPKSVTQKRISEAEAKHNKELDDLVSAYPIARRKNSADIPEHAFPENATSVRPAVKDEVTKDEVTKDEVTKDEVTKDEDIITDPMKDLMDGPKLRALVDMVNAAAEGVSEEYVLSAKLDALVKGGFLSEMPTDEGNSSIVDYAGRPIVMVNMAEGFQIPFYASTGAAGKKSVAVGSWHAIMGIGSGGWINKGSEDQINSEYNSAHWKHAARVLNLTLGAEEAFKYDLPIVDLGSAAMEHINGALGVSTPPAASAKDSTAFYSRLAAVIGRLNEAFEDSKNQSQKPEVKKSQQAVKKTAELSASKQGDMFGEDSKKDTLEGRSFTLGYQNYKDPVGLDGITSKGYVSGMRSGGKNITNAAPNTPGWLGNPFYWSGNQQPFHKGQFDGVTLEQAIDSFRKVFNERIKDPEFRVAIEALRGKTVGYYKPTAKDQSDNHLRIIQEWLASQSGASNEETSNEVTSNEVTKDEEITDAQEPESPIDHTSTPEDIEKDINGADRIREGFWKQRVGNNPGLRAEATANMQTMLATVKDLYSKVAGKVRTMDQFEKDYKEHTGEDFKYENGKRSSGMYFNNKVYVDDTLDAIRATSTLLHEYGHVLDADNRLSKKWALENQNEVKKVLILIHGDAPMKGSELWQKSNELVAEFNVIRHLLPDEAKKTAPVLFGMLEAKLAEQQEYGLSGMVFPEGITKISGSKNGKVGYDVSKYNSDVTGIRKSYDAATLDANGKRTGDPAANKELLFNLYRDYLAEHPELVKELWEGALAKGGKLVDRNFMNASGTVSEARGHSQIYAHILNQMAQGVPVSQASYEGMSDEEARSLNDEGLNDQYEDFSGEEDFDAVQAQWRAEHSELSDEEFMDEELSYEEPSASLVDQAALDLLSKNPKDPDRVMASNPKAWKKIFEDNGVYDKAKSYNDMLEDLRGKAFAKDTRQALSEQKQEVKALRDRFNAGPEEGDAFAKAVEAYEAKYGKIFKHDKGASKEKDSLIKTISELSDQRKTDPDNADIKSALNAVFKAFKNRIGHDYKSNEARKESLGAKSKAAEFLEEAAERRKAKEAEDAAIDARGGPLDSASIKANLKQASKMFPAFVFEHSVSGDERASINGNKVRVNVNKLKSVADLWDAIEHEVTGHGAARLVLGNLLGGDKQFTDFLDLVKDSGNSQVADALASVQKDYDEKLWSEEVWAKLSESATRPEGYKAKTVEEAMNRVKSEAEKHNLSDEAINDLHNSIRQEVLSKYEGGNFKSAGIIEDFLHAVGNVAGTAGKWTVHKIRGRVPGGEALINGIEALGKGAWGIVSPMSTSVDPQVRAMGMHKVADWFHHATGSLGHEFKETIPEMEARQRMLDIYGVGGLYDTLEALPKKRGEWNPLKSRSDKAHNALVDKVMREAYEAAASGRKVVEVGNSEVSSVDVHSRVMAFLGKTNNRWLQVDDKGNRSGEFTTLNPNSLAKHLPMYADQKQWREHKKDIIDLLASSKDLSRKQAEDLYEDRLRSTGLTEVATDTPMTSSFGLWNEFPEDIREELVKYMDYDIGGSLQSYVHAGTKRGVLDKYLGDWVSTSSGKPVFNAIAKIQEEVDKLSKTDNARFTNVILPAYLGTLGSRMNPALRSVNAWGTVFLNTTLLPLAITSQLVDLGGMAVRDEHALRLLKTMYKLMRNDKDFRKQIAEQADIAIPALHRAYADIASQEHMGSTTKAAKINSAFFKMNLMQTWSHASRVLAFTMSKEAVQRYGRLAESEDPKVAQRAIDDLAEIGLTPEGIKDMDWDGKLSPEINTALNHWVNSAVLKPGAPIRPAWMSDSSKVLFAYLHGFTAATHEIFTKRIMHNVSRRTGGARLAPMLIAGSLMIPAVMVGASIRAMIAGIGADDDKKRREQGIMALFMRTGIGGQVGNTLWDMKQSQEHGGGLLSSMFVATNVLEQMLDTVSVDPETGLPSWDKRKFIGKHTPVLSASKAYQQAWGSSKKSDL